MPRASFDDWFDRELAELKAGLEKLEASLEPRLSHPIAKTKPVTRPSARSKRGGGRARKAAVLPPTAPSPSAPPAGVEPAPAPATVTKPPAAPAPQSASAASAPAPSNAGAQPTTPPPPPPRPSGADLRDPKNFGLEPPMGELERGSSRSEDYRQRLTRHIAYCSQVLHTSGVPAAVWREWRAFERAAQERLRELNTRPPDPDSDA